MTDLRLPSVLPCKVLQCTLSRLISIELTLRIVCGRTEMRPPVITDLRNMCDFTIHIRLRIKKTSFCILWSFLSDLIYSAEKQIIILCTVIVAAKLQLFHKICTDRRKMTDVIIGKQIVQIKIRLPVRLKHGRSGLVDLILIGI